MAWMKKCSTERAPKNAAVCEKKYQGDMEEIKNEN